jgi:glycogen debranching enzyme
LQCSSAVSTILIRPEQRYAWCGPSLLITGIQGDCGADPLGGYYFREARHLKTLSLTIDGVRPWLCEANAPEPSRLDFVFIHPERTSFSGGGSGQSGDEVQRDDHGIPFRSLDLLLTYAVGAAGLSISLLISNHALAAVDFELAWTLDADFADIQEAHGHFREQEAPVRCLTDGPDGLELRFVYGHEDLSLATRVTIAGDADWRAEPGRLAARMHLEPKQSGQCLLTVEPIDGEEPLDRDEARRREERLRAWREGMARVRIPGNGFAERVVQNNVRDVASFPLLDGVEEEWLALQAGVPLYPAFFGRDALTAGWQAMFLDRGASLEASLARLGRQQGTCVDAWRDEEPGRLLDQARRGPLARLGRNPFGRYYGDFASPLMAVVALAHLFGWSGDRTVLDRHWDAARRALDWAREDGDRDGDGYLEYQARSPQGVKNQGWKDSGNAIVDLEGRSVPAPLGTCELQGYWYAALQFMGLLARFRGEHADGRAYQQEARDLKERFNRDWWMPDESCFAMARGPDKQLVRSIGSNAGQCLATGIVNDEHVQPLAARLFAPDLFSGWGIRTLSSGHAAYNPLSYHLGTVWAVENATIALGLRRYGLDVRAAELAEGLFALARLYAEDRIPECVGGTSRWERPSPGVYPRANTPQAWNASAISLLIQTLLGLQPVAPLDLLVVDPALPSWLPEIVIHGLRLGGATFTLRAWRDAQGSSHAEIVEKRGTVHLLRQPPLESLSAGALDRVAALFETLIHH